MRTTLSRTMLYQESLSCPRLAKNCYLLPRHIGIDKYFDAHTKHGFTAPPPPYDDIDYSDRRAWFANRIDQLVESFAINTASTTSQLNPRSPTQKTTVNQLKYPRHFGQQSPQNPAFQRIARYVIYTHISTLKRVPPALISLSFQCSEPTR